MARQNTAQVVQNMPRYVDQKVLLRKRYARFSDENGTKSKCARARATSHENTKQNNGTKEEKLLMPFTKPVFTKTGNQLLMMNFDPLLFMTMFDFSARQTNKRC